MHKYQTVFWIGFIVAVSFFLSKAAPAQASIVQNETASVYSPPYTNVCGTISTNSTWTLINSPYLVTCNVTVANGVTLSIEAGVIVKFQYYPASPRSLLVNGVLSLGGTAATPVVFTSERDDAYGGDTNGDGGATTPAPGDWSSITIANGANDFHHAIVRYGGTSSGMLYISSVSPTVRENRFEQWYDKAIVSSGSATSPARPQINQNVFASTAGWYAFAQSNYAFPSYSANDISQVRYQGIVVWGDLNPSTTRTETWENWGYPYVIGSGTDHLTIGSLMTLHIPAGVIVKFEVNAYNRRYLSVNGVLSLGGTTANPVVFTSERDDAYGGDTNGDGGATTPAPGDWKYIQINNSANDFHDTIVRYGGGAGQAMVYINGASPVVRDSYLDHASGQAVSITSGNPSLSQNTIGPNPAYGIYVYSGAPVIHNNNIQGNASYGLFNAGASVTVNAEENWWGNASGPTHAGNPGGSGDRVSDHVEYAPWRTSPYVIYYTASGTVRDGNGSPLPGVTVSAATGQTAVTDTSGQYTVIQLPAGSHTLTPIKAGYVFTPTQRVVLVPPNRTAVDFTGTQQLAGSLTLSSIYPARGQPSRGMQGAVIHRYFELRDQAGLLAPFVTVAFGSHGSATTSSAGRLDFSLDSAALGGVGTYPISATGASRWGTAYTLGGDTTFDILLETRPFTHTWSAGTIRTARGGINAGWIAYLRGESRGGLEWALTETDAGTAIDDKLAISESYQAEVGGGAGVGFKPGFSVGVIHLGAGASAVSELAYQSEEEMQCAFDAPYTPDAQKAQAAMVLGSLIDLAPGSPAKPLLSFALARVFPASGYAPFVAQESVGAGIEWHPVQLHAGVKIGIVGPTRIAAAHTVTSTIGILDSTTINLDLSLDALEVDVMLRLFGTYTDYWLEQEYSLALEQEVGVDLAVLSAHVPVIGRLGLYADDQTAKIKEELVFDRNTDQPVRLELSLTGEANPSTFHSDLHVQSVTVRFIVIGQELDLALSRIRNLTALLAARDRISSQGLIVGGPAALQEVEAYLTAIPLSRYEVSAKTETHAEWVPSIEWDAGWTIELGQGIEFGFGRELVIERGYLTLGGMYPTDVYPDYTYGTQSGKTIWDLLANAVTGAREIIGDAIHSFTETITQGVSWVVNTVSRTVSGVVRGGATLSGQPGGSDQPNGDEEMPLSMTQAFTLTATSWVPDVTGVVDNHVLSASGAGFVIGGVYEFSPYTMTLSPPATLAITYTVEAAGTANPMQFAIYRWQPHESNWQPLPGTHDLANRVITTTVGQLGTYAVGYDVVTPTVLPLSPGHVVTTTHFPQIGAVVTDSGTGIDPGTVSLSLAGVPVSANYASLSGHLWYTPTNLLANGIYSYTITAADTAGNWITDTHQFTVAVPNPDIIRVVPHVVYRTGHPRVVIEGSAFAYSSTLQVDTTVLTDTNYLWLTTMTATIPTLLDYGGHDLTITSPDGGTGTLSNALYLTTWGDVTGDCAVTALDLQAVADRWSLTALQPDPDNNPATPNYELHMDLNRDERIDIVDIGLVAKAWGASCSSSLP